MLIDLVLKLVPQDKVSFAHEAVTDSDQAIVENYLQRTGLVPKENTDDQD
jgi:hypothetical protein